MTGWSTILLRILIHDFPLRFKQNFSFSYFSMKKRTLQNIRTFFNDKTKKKKNVFFFV
jgi:hypothetical protein